MRLKTVVKLCTIISVALFCIAVGFYALMQLDMADRNRDVNLYTFLPEDCPVVFESDNINEFLNDKSQLSYAFHLDKAVVSGLFDFILNGLNEYATTNAHGLSYQMNRVLVGYDQSCNPLNQIIIFRTGVSDDGILEDMLQEYTSYSFHPKEEFYRGKRIVIYPLGTDEYIAAYAELGFLVISYHKKLLEKAIDAKLEGQSLYDNLAFRKMLEHRKSHTHFSLFAKSSIFPFLNVSDDCWSDFDFHTSSDVLYLTGHTYMPDSCNNQLVLSDFADNFTLAEEDSLFITMEKDSIQNYILRVDEKDSRSLFEQNIVNLSKDASFTIVADMKLVADTPNAFISYFPAVMLDNIEFFRPFIFSSQYMLKEEGLSHIWIFTYKD